MTAERTPQTIAAANRINRLHNLKSQVKLVIWDFNGCLLNDLEYMYQHGVCYIFNEFGLEPPTIQQYQDEASSNFLKFYHKYGVAESETEASLDKMLKESYLMQKDKPLLFEDVPLTLQIIKDHGIDQEMVTAFNYESTHSILKDACMLNYFYEINASVKHKAPLIISLIKRCGLESSNVIGITDTTSDVAAFIEAGIKPYICSRGFHSLEKIQSEQELYPEMIVVSQFSEILEKEGWA